MNQLRAPVMNNLNNDATRKSALFSITASTLTSSGEWKFQCFVGWMIALIGVSYGLYWMEIPFETKALAIISYLFCCAMAVNLSKIKRDYYEADKIETLAKDTDIYVHSHVETLKGSTALHMYGWLVFLFSFVSMIYCIERIDMSTERRGYLLIGGFTLLMQTFTATKTIRDSVDGEKWKNMYYEGNHRN